MPRDEYLQAADQAGLAPESLAGSTELILSEIEKSAEIVFPVIHSGMMPIHYEREKVHKATRLLCLKADSLVKALRKAMIFLNEDQIEQVEDEINL